MSSRSARVPAALAGLPRSYLALLAEFPLRPIRSGAEYERAAKIVHRLALREDELDGGEEAYLEVLEALVERYDNELEKVTHIVFMAGPPRGVCWAGPRGRVSGEAMPRLCIGNGGRGNPAPT